MSERDWDRIRELEAEAERLREAIRAYLVGAPLNENGRFTDAAREALYRAAAT